MASFIITFLLVYGLLNSYCYLKLRVLFSNVAYGQFLLLGFIALMVVGPILVRLLERAEYVSIAYILAIVTYNWMALIIWFDLIAGIIDILNLLIVGIKFLWSQSYFFPISTKSALLITLIIVSVAWLYSFVEAKDIVVESIDVLSPKIPVGTKVKILQISDLHIGILEREQRLKQVSHHVSQLKPDMIISTGDLLDGMDGQFNHLYEYLHQLPAPLGKFAVLGNHDVYVGLNKSIEFHRLSGFSLLRNQSIDIPVSNISLIGVDDPGRTKPNIEMDSIEKQLLTSANKERFTIFLKHQPIIDTQLANNFNLMLSGHTHRGQIFPFGLIVKFTYPYLSGTFQLTPTSLLYVNRGTGTWGPPLRLFAPPEITLFTIRGTKE